MLEPMQQPDDIVSRAVGAVRGLPVPEGPPQAIAAQTLAALDEAATHPKTTLPQRVYRMPWKSTAAALAGLAATALVAYIALSPSPSNSRVWAAAINKIVDAKTLICDMVMHAGGEKGLVCKGQLLFDEANNTRADLHTEFQNQQDDATLILNVTTGKSILLVKGQKTAVTNPVMIGDQNFLKESAFDRIKAVAKESTQSLGKTQIDGVQCEGFEVRRGITVRLWVNMGTGDPVRLEELDLTLPQPLGRGNVVLSKFNIDEKIDPSMFETDPPEGYTVIKSPITIDLTGKPANDLAVILRQYAKESEGRFPERLLDPEDPSFKKLNTTSDDMNEKPNAGNMQLALAQASILRLRTYLQARKEGTDYQYYPGVTLGEKDRIVFWTRNVKTGEYMAIYGDLRVEKIAKEKLPSVPQSDAKK